MERLHLGAKKLGLNLDSGQLEQFQTYYDELIGWNSRMNLTHITDYEDVQVKHFLDSLTVTLAFRQTISAAGASLIDVGTGGGLPGLPLKIVFRHIKLVLLDSITKKSTFLRHIKEKLGLDDVEVVVGRAEEVAHQTPYREQFDIVLARAVAPLPTLVELTLPFCKIGGRLIAQKKGDTDPEISQAGRAIDLLGGRLGGVKRIELEEFDDDRQLIIIDKIAATPPQYPRRPGIPAKRPLL